MSGQSVKRANKRYCRDFFIAMLFYVIVVIGGAFLLKSYEMPPQWLSILVALLSALPIIGVFLLMGRQLLETDEYTRKRQIDILLIAGGVTLSLCVAWGFLEFSETVPHISPFWAGPIFFFAMGISTGVRRIREGGSHS